MRSAGWNVVHLGGRRHRDGVRITVKEGFGYEGVEVFRRVSGQTAPPETRRTFHEIGGEMSQAACLTAHASQAACPQPFRLQPIVRASLASSLV